jgi:hypothetical protein
MRYAFALLGIEVFVFGLAGSASATSLYLTTVNPIPTVSYGSNDSYAFIAPYCIYVRNRISVSIAKAAGAQNSTGNATAVKITGAVWSSDTKQTTYQLNCDLASVLEAGSNINITEVTTTAPGTNGFNVTDAKVAAVTSAPTVVVNQGANPGTYKTGGTIAGLTCPPAAASISATIGVSPIPIQRGYLYLLKDAFYSDTVNVGVGTDCMLTSSDTSSVQEITTILNELAQTAAAIPKGQFSLSQGGARKQCFKEVSDLTTSGPYVDEFAIGDIKSTKRQTRWGVRDGWSYPITNSVVLRLEPLIRGHIEKIGKLQPGLGWVQPGLVAYFPAPAEASIICNADQAIENQIFLNAPATVNLYTDRHVLDPQRDFLTGPQDTLTFSQGFFTGHKYSDQSAAKTIVDTVTGPIRAIMPSVTVTQSVAVSPTGKTTTTSTQTAPPKGP